MVLPLSTVFKKARRGWVALISSGFFTSTRKVSSTTASASGERHAIELKLRRDEETEPDGIEQLSGYMDSAGLTEGWLVIFDLRSTRPWSERLYQRPVERDGRRIVIVGC